MKHRGKRGSHVRRILVAGCLGAVTLAAAACGSSASNPPASSGSAQAAATVSGAGGAVAAAQADIAKYARAVTSYASQQPVAGVSRLRGKTVWYIPIGASVPALAADGAAMQAALSHVGITMRTCDGKFLPTDAATCISQAITQGADGVVTGFIDYAELPNSFNDLVAHHIPVLVAGEAPDGGKVSSPQLAFFNIQATIDLMQKLEMDGVIADSRGKAHVLYVGVTDSPTTVNAANYAESYLTSHCRGCTLNEISYNTASISKVPSQVSAGLIAHPGTTYVVDEYDTAAEASVEGIETAGYATKVKLAAADGDLDSLQRIRSNDVEFIDVGSSSVYEGWQFADGIIRMLLGHTPSPGLGVVRVFTSGNVGRLALTPAAFATNAWYGSNAYEQAFLTAWEAK